MRRIISAVLLLLIMTVTAQSWTRLEPVRLWNNGGLTSRGITMTPYLPTHNNKGVAVVVCPGGSYFWLDPRNESSLVGEWLASNGIAAFVLRYSVGSIGGFITHWRKPFGGAVYPAPLEDAQHALLHIRRNALLYNVNTERVGIMGFSAGGHLAVLAAEQGDNDMLSPHNIKTDQPLMPNFVAAIYPVVSLSNDTISHRRSARGLLGEKNSRDKELLEKLSLEKNIHNHMPPVFLSNCKDDPTVNYLNAVVLDKALSNANVPHTYLLYDKGGHGYGASDKKGSDMSRQWKNQFITWINNLYE